MTERVKFYLDEHVSHEIASQLRNRGIDVVTCQEVGMRSASDPEHLAKASSLGRVIFTQDDDFLALHSEGIVHTGIAYRRQGASIGEIVYGLTLIWELVDTEEMKNHLEYLVVR